MRRVSGLVLLAALLASLLLPAHRSAPAQAAAIQPNVVFILTDDMRADDLRYMRFTRELFAESGTTFTHALSPHPLCCPARAELVTGQYAQNNGVWHNQPEYGGGWQGLRAKDHMIFEWFRQAGYRTGYIGKFLNGYVGQEPLIGLTDNDAAVRNIYSPYDLWTYNDGTPVEHPGHQTYAVRDRTIRVIRSSDQPFFMWAGYVAPHTMKAPGGDWTLPVPPEGYTEPRHKGDFLLQVRPGERDVSDKPRVVRKYKLPDVTKLREHHRARVLSLYAVDDAVRDTVQALKDAGEYDDTILVFASDNGYLLGEHNQHGKNWPYQASVRVPLLMSGPGVPHTVIDDVTTLVDLPVTLARLTGVTPLLEQDGADLFTRPRDRAVLIQAGDGKGRVPWEWRGVYTRRYTYVRHHDGAEEFYDRRLDPRENQSRPGHRKVPRFRALLRRLRECAGTTCEQTL